MLGSTASVCHNFADPISRNPAFHALQLHAARCSHDMHALQAKDSESDSEADMNIYDSLNVSAHFLQCVRNGYAADPWFANEANTKDLTFIGGHWRKGELIIVPDASDLRKQCLTLHHDAPYAGHLGRDRTKRLIMQTYWWPMLDRNVSHFVSTCDFCQRNKSTNEKPAGLLQPLPIPEFRWQSVSMDFIAELPKTKAGHTAIFLFVDRLSKMVPFAPRRWNDIGSQEFAQIFLRNFFAKHGLPTEVVTDRQFTSAFWKSVAQLLGVQQCLTSACRPQLDGQTERTNHTLEEILRHLVSPSYDDWDVRLPCCKFAINNAWNQLTVNTPFFLNPGELPRSPINVNKVCKLPAADTFIGRIKTAIAAAKDSLRYAQQRMSDAYNAKLRDEASQVGEFAFLSPKGLSLSAAGSKKFMAKQLGPFEITAKVGRLAYQLLLPASMSRVHPVFHVSLHRRPKDGGCNAAPPPAMLLDGFEECEIDKVLQHRPEPHKRQPNHKECFVSWKGRGPEERAWLSEHKLKNAADVVQEYRDRLQSLTRPAPRPGKATTEDPQYVDTSASPAHAASTAPAQQQKKHGQPAKRRSCSPSHKQHKTAAGGQTAGSDDQHVCQISTDFIFGALMYACFEVSSCTQLKHDCWPCEPHMCLPLEQCVSYFNE